MYVPVARRIRIHNARYAGDIIFTTRSSREGYRAPFPWRFHRRHPVSGCKLNNVPGRIYVTATKGGRRGGGFYRGGGGRWPHRRGWITLLTWRTSLVFNARSSASEVPIVKRSLGDFVTTAMNLMTRSLSLLENLFNSFKSSWVISKETVEARSYLLFFNRCCLVWFCSNLLILINSIYVKKIWHLYCYRNFYKFFLYKKKLTCTLIQMLLLSFQKASELKIVAN